MAFLVWPHTFSSCVAPMRLMMILSSVRDDFALLGMGRIVWTGDLDSMGAISKVRVMVACDAEAANASVYVITRYSRGRIAR